MLNTDFHKVHKTDRQNFRQVGVLMIHKFSTGFVNYQKGPDVQCNTPNITTLLATLSLTHHLHGKGLTEQNMFQTSMNRLPKPYQKF